MAHILGTLAVLTFLVLSGPAVLGGLFWPSLDTGRRMLVRWALPSPTREQQRLAMAYLRRRRLLVTLFYTGVPAVLIAVDLARRMVFCLQVERDYVWVFHRAAAPTWDGITGLTHLLRAYGSWADAALVLLVLAECLALLRLRPPVPARTEEFAR